MNSSTKLRRLGRIHRTLLVWSLTGSVGLPTVSLAGTFVAFGPETYVRSTGEPVRARTGFSVLNPNNIYTIRIDNGGLSDSKLERVSNSVIILNGTQIVGPGELNQNVALIEKPVTLAFHNELAVELRGRSGGSLTIQISGVDNDPPTIVATANPPPNAAGWNNRDVGVTFICSDATSGVATCPGPVTLETEGANQAVEGTAVDRAGNTSTARVAINLDKTPPVVSITSPAEGTTTRNRFVPVTGTVTDANPITALTVNGAPVTLGANAFSTELTLSEGNQTIAVEARDIADNPRSAQVAIVVSIPPLLNITSPLNLSAFAISPITVTGTVDDPQASITVNGVPAATANGTFTAPGVPLREGPNIITAVGTDAQGNAGTASITVTLDTTPPRVTIDSPPDGFVTPDASITVAGMINDIVVGTVNGQQARVTVNGVEAQVANRAFLATDIPLSAGGNTITAIGTDRAGNFAGTSISVTLDVVAANRLKLVSGNNQHGAVSAVLPDPLVVALTDADSNPVAGRVVIFKVMENNGALSSGGAEARSLAVTTDALGRAQARWRLGTRAGAGNNIVEATAVGFAGVAIFTARAFAAAPDKISLDAGNNQTGVAGQPLPRPFVGIVTDAGHNRLSGIAVTFTVRQGGGSFNGQPAFTIDTDSDGLAQAVLTLGEQEGILNNVVEASFPSNPSAAIFFSASAKVAADPALTRIGGVVLDNTDIPIPGVTLHIAGTALAAVADGQGQFVIQPAPVGHVKLLADGSTAQRPGVWPNLEYDLVTVAGQTNTIGMPIYLLPLDMTNGLFVDETHGGTLTLPEVPGFSLTVQPDSATFPNGSRSGVISVTVVHPDKVPMTPNFGQQPRFIVTIQPAGVHFDPPAPISIPNADGLVPGEVTEMYSFDHDLGQFVSIGTGTVSEDGSVLRSDPGVGIIKGGWHCGGNPAGIGTCEHECDDGNDCTIDELVGGRCQHTPTGGNVCRNAEPNFDLACGSRKVTINILDSCRGRCVSGVCMNRPFGIDGARQAVTSAVGSTCGTCIDDASGLRTTMQNCLVMNGFKVACDPTPGDPGLCAHASPGSNTLTLTPLSLDLAECGSLAQSALHEMIHGCASFRHRKCQISDGAALGEINCSNAPDPNDCEACPDPATDRAYGCEAKCGYGAPPALPDVDPKACQ